MTRLTLGGTPIYTDGHLPARGQLAPAFTLTASTWVDLDLRHFAGRCKLLLTAPSLELPLRAASAHAFDEAVRSLGSAVLLLVTSDLPFSNGSRHGVGSAHARASTQVLSNFRSPGFARAYGVAIASGPLKGLLAPAVFVLDRSDRVVHAELVREMDGPPDMGSAIAALRVAIDRVSATPVAATAVASVAS